MLIAWMRLSFVEGKRSRASNRILRCTSEALKVYHFKFATTSSLDQQVAAQKSPCPPWDRLCPLI